MSTWNANPPDDVAEINERSRITPARFQELIASRYGESLEEMARRRKKIPRDDELKPIVPAFDKPEELDPSQDEMTLAMDMLRGIVQVGIERRQELEAALGDQQRTGEWWIPNAINGTYSDFEEQANYQYFKDTYSWLHASGERVGIDSTKATENYQDLESWLASIPHSEWQAFLTDLEEMQGEGWIYKNEDIAQELRNKEEARWMKEDGFPDLVKAMRDSAPDAYDGYLLSKAPEDLVWEWCQESGNYPEAGGDGSVWLDMEELGAKEETREWWLDHIDEDPKGWETVKTEAYNDGGLAIMDMALKKLAQEDEQIATVYNQLDDPHLWELWMKSFPDEPKHEGDPRWYYYRPDYFNREREKEAWRPGFPFVHPEGQPRSTPSNWWKEGLMHAFDYLATQPWWINMVRNWTRRPPEGHPEFEFESRLREALDYPDPDDPLMYVKHAGGVQEEPVYSDDKIIVFYPRTLEAINWHLERAGKPKMVAEQWNSMKYGDIFIIVGKEPDDLLGHQGRKELGIVYGDVAEGLRAWKTTYNDKTSVASLTADPIYGKSIKRMLLRFYRERGDSDAGRIFLDIGGPKVLRRAAARGQVDLKYHTTSLGLHYVAQKKYQLAAKTFNRDPKTVGPQGVQLLYNDVSDLTNLFKNPEWAKDVFDHETWSWFDGYYGHQDVDDVVPFLDAAAMKSVREALVNRRVWFPDGGPEQQGDYVILTPSMIAGYTDEEILDWIVKPSDEDVESGVFDDVQEAFKDAASDILIAAAQDELYSGVVKEAVSTLGGIKHEWVQHPTKKGADAFAVLVPWDVIKDAAEKYRGDNNQEWTGSLEDLMLEVNWKTLEVDSSRYEPSWRDVNKEWAKDNLNRIHDLEAPDFPEDPNQVQLPIGEGLDDPDAMPDMLSGVPPGLARALLADLEVYTKQWGVIVKDFKVAFEYDPARYGQLLRVSFKPEGAWIDREEDALRAHGWSSAAYYMTHKVVNAYTDTWAVMEPYFSEDAPPGYIWIIWPMHKRNDPDIPF